MRLFIDDTAGIGVLEMRAKARRLKSEHGLNLLIVDYIQLMTGRGRFENRTLELGVDLAVAQGAGQGAERPDRRAVAVEPRARGALGPSPAALRSSRIRRAGTGCRPGRPDLSRRCLQQGSQQPRRRHGGADPRQAAQRSDRRRAAGVPPRADALREPGAGGGSPGTACTGRDGPQHGARTSNSERRCSTTSRAIRAHLRAIETARRHAARHHRRRQGQRLRPGAERVALALEQAGAAMLACADIEEGVVLRRAGVRVPILVFGALSVSDLDGVFELRADADDLEPVGGAGGAGRGARRAARPSAIT